MGTQVSNGFSITSITIIQACINYVRENLQYALRKNDFGLHYLVSFNGNNILPVVIFLSQIY